MRLRQFSTWLFALVLIILAANALILLLVQGSYDQVVAAQDHRQRSQSREEHEAATSPMLHERSAAIAFA